MDQNEQLEIALETIRPQIRAHGGEVRLTAFEDGVVYLRLSGACAGCPAADQGTKSWIRERLQAQLPGIRQVELVQDLDPELIQFARERLRRLSEPDGSAP